MDIFTLYWHIIPWMPFNTWIYFSHRLLLQYIIIQEIILSSSFFPSHPKESLGPQWSWRVFINPNLHIIIYIKKGWLQYWGWQTEDLGGKAVTMFLVVLQNEEVLMKEQGHWENTTIWLPWCFLWPYQPFFLPSLNNETEGQVLPFIVTGPILTEQS